MQTPVISEKKSTLSPLFENIGFNLSLLGIIFLLALINTFFKSNDYIGGWHILFYLLLLAPLGLPHVFKNLKNRYVLRLIPILLIWIFDIFYYNNDLTTYFLPTILLSVIALIYLSAMQEVSAFYQTFLPQHFLQFRPFSYLSAFFIHFAYLKKLSNTYGRILFALLITVPFLVAFTLLLTSADESFDKMIRSFFTFTPPFRIEYFTTLPITLFLFLLFFLYALSNRGERVPSREKPPFDQLIVTIFLGLISGLFALFIVTQLLFLFQSNTVVAENHPYGLAYFARQGFFQLMVVMTLVASIYLFIMRRFKGEKRIVFFLSLLLIETMIMGMASLKKMYLYQSIKGATVLRYYVEWFDYFLLITLSLGILFLIKRFAFQKLLNTLFILGLLSFTLIASIDIDHLVASANIEKFKNTPEKLDKYALGKLSVDALPAVKGMNGVQKKVINNRGLRRNCHTFATYHYGYCSRIDVDTIKSPTPSPHPKESH